MKLLLLFFTCLSLSFLSHATPLPISTSTAETVETEFVRVSGNLTRVRIEQSTGMYVLSVMISKPAKAPLIRYDELTITAADEKGNALAVRKEFDMLNVLIEATGRNSLAQGVYTVDLPNGRRIATVTVGRNNQAHTFTIPVSVPK